MTPSFICAFTRDKVHSEPSLITYDIWMSHVESKAPGGASNVEMIRQDLACPACGYNLRGLPGAVVTCPECGTVCDVATLVTEQWTQSWWKAPGFNVIIGPAATLMVGVVLTLLAIALSSTQLMSPWFAVIFAVVVVSYWCYLWHGVYRRFGDAWSLLLTLLAHAIATGMIVSAIAMIMTALFCLLEFMRSPDLIRVATYALVFLIAIVTLFFCRKGEKFIAGHCIRLHLASRAKEAASDRHTAESPSTGAT